jgi:hypothetical protein
MAKERMAQRPKGHLLTISTRAQMKNANDPMK